jgi:hypothetical protein
VLIRDQGFVAPALLVSRIVNSMSDTGHANRSAAQGSISCTHPRHTAAKDRTFKTIRPNQGTASGTVPIRRRPSL